MPVPLGPRRICFPLLKTEATLRRSGLHAARHIEGAPCHPTPELLRLLAAAREHAPELSAPVEYIALSGHDCLGDVLLGEAEATIRLDADVAALVSGSAAGPALYAMALEYLRSVAASGSEGEAMAGLLETFVEADDASRGGVLRLLTTNGLDPNGLLGRFLGQGASAGATERQRLVAWLRARMVVEIPYDQGLTASRMSMAGDLGALRATAYRCTRETLEPAVDFANAERVVADCLERGVQLVTGRFSRAFYVEALLLANAKVLPTALLIEPIAQLCAAARASEALHELAPEITRIESIMGGDSVSQAEIARAMRALRTEVSRIETSVLAGLDGAAAKAVEKPRQALCLPLTGAMNRAPMPSARPVGAQFIAPKASSPASATETSRAECQGSLIEERARIRAVTDAVRDAALRAESAASAITGHSPAFVVFFQRMTPHGTLNAALLNEMRDPFFGENEEILDLLLRGGHNTYVTSELSPWLRRCDHWVEAVPAFASHRITPREGGGYEVDAWVQRGALEDLYRGCAEDWLLNIEHVMALEHVPLARALVAGWLELGDQIATVAASDGLSAEEATRHVLSDIGAEDLIGGLAALIERTADALCEDVAALVVEHSLERHDALARSLRQSDSEANLVRHVLRDAGLSAEGLALALAHALETHDLAARAHALRPVAFMRRRELPCAHVLTTLGPGETEGNIAPWLEESMSLFAASRAHGLEPLISERVEAERERLLSVAESLIEQMDLQRQMLETALTEGLDSAEPGGRGRILEALLTSIPEFACEVGRIVSGRGVEGADEEALVYVRDRLTPLRATRLVRENAVREAGLEGLLDSPRFRFGCTGPYKRYHLVYTPSRVDLGAHEVASVRDVPKWIGGADRASAQVAARLYSLHNVGGPVALASPQLAEFMKVGENFFTRSAVFYTSLAAGANIDALGLGDFEACCDQWNLRGDRIVLPTGETYGGFCIPKEFSLLIAAVESMGRDHPDQDLSLVRWVNTKALGLEEINRIGPFRKVALIRQLLADARTVRPEVANDTEAIGVMAAAYKEGARIGDREAPINDVRFSAGARKLEIYAGTAGDSLLRDIDPDGRALVREMFEGFRSPADVRMVGLCTAVDVFGYVPHSRLDALATESRDLLTEAGLSDALIAANSAVYGADLARWSGIREMSSTDRTALLATVGDRRHLVTLVARGIVPTYAEAVQGIDFLDLGIPDPELLDLIDDLPRLVSLMKLGRENSALVFADGASGARRRAFSFRYASGKRKVQELFALEPRAQYGALGLGAATIAGWRDEMHSLRNLAEDSWHAVRQGTVEAMATAWLRLCHETIRLGMADEAVTEAERARDLGLDMRPYALRAHLLGRVRHGLPIQSLDFGAWLLLGGAFLLSGRTSRERLAELRCTFEAVMSAVAGASERLPSVHVDAIIAEYFRPLHSPQPTGPTSEADTGVGGSLKAAEERHVRLERREVRKKMALRAVALQHRRAAFDIAPLPKAPDMAAAHAVAMGLLGSPERDVSPEAFGRFLAQLHVALASVWPTEGGAQAVGVYIDGGEVTAEAHRALSTGLVVPVEGPQQALCLRLAGAMNRAPTPSAEPVGAQFIAPNAFPNRPLVASATGAGRRDAALEETAMALELLDIALAIEMTQGVPDGAELAVAIARYFDIALNSHLFDCLPYHYHKDHGPAFEQLTRAETLELAARRHRWLYAFLRHRLATRTDMAALGAGYALAWLGEWGDAEVAPPLGGQGDSPWFGYARLRDAAVLRHEGYAFPEILDGVPPEALKCATRANVAVVYPHGNTTVPVALEQGPMLAAQDGVNLWLCAWPTLTAAGRLELPDALCFLSREDYAATLVAMGIPQSEAEARTRGIDRAGRLCLVRFTHPATAHAAFLHFTHPLRPEIGDLGLPIIQPFIWEAATHLKCRLPDMLRGSGTRTADQVNWLRSEAEGLSPPEAKKRIETIIGDMATRHDWLIVKAEKESGGRRARLLQVRRGSEVDDAAVRDLAALAHTIVQTDNAVIQQALESHVRRLYTREFLEDMVARFAHLCIAVHIDRSPQAPLYSYFRQVLVRGESGYEITHNITVISTRGVANVGQGGLLYEYTDDIIAAHYRLDLREAMTEAALGSLEAQRRYLRAHWREVLEDYLLARPEYATRVARELKKDLTGFESCDIPYEMGDFMPVFLVDADDCLTHVFDYQAEDRAPLFSDDGQPTQVTLHTSNGSPIARAASDGSPLRIPMFDDHGLPIARYDAFGRRVRTLHCYKIEANPGAGLWRPHNDRLPEERTGEGVYRIFRALGRRAHLYRERLGEHR